MKLKFELFDDNGKLISVGETRLTAAVPAPAPAERLQGSYFSSDDLLAAIPKAAPIYMVLCDTNDGPGVVGLPGSGKLRPAIHYGTAANRATVNLMNPDHPAFAVAVAASDLSDVAKSAAIPTAKALSAAASGVTDPTKLWETAESTTPPLETAFLLHWFGYTVDGKTPAQQAAAHRKWYYTRWGRQAPGGPRNAEADWITDAEIAAIIAG